MLIVLRILGFLACLQVASFVILTAWTAVPIPIADIIDITYPYLAGGFSWTWLLAPHNEHVILLPRLLLIADLALTNGHMLVFVGVSLLSWGAVFLMILHAVRMATADRHLCVFSAAVLALLLFRAFFLQGVVLNNGFNYQLTAVLAVAAFMLAARVQPSRISYLPATISALAALASSFCLINGLIAIPLAAALACMRSRSPFTLFPFAIAFAIGMACYLRGAASDTRTLVIEPLLWPQAFIGLFGAPWTYRLGIIGELAGAVVLLLACAALLYARRQLRHLDPQIALATTLLLFGLGSAGMIVLGRPNELTAMAVQGRYGLWVALVYAGILLIALRLPGIQELSRRPLVSTIAIMVGIALLAEQVMVGSFYIERANNMQVAAEHLRAGDRSEAALDTVKSLIPASRPAFDLYAARGLYGFRHAGR